tara:strand:- start:4214 stop:5584 length:1371 start_codon:yes stop_codon:yes gene_type:complete
MSWKQILTDAGLSEREVDAVIVLSSKSNLKASELAKELGTTRLDAYNSLERLQTIGLVTVTADRPMRFSSPPINEAVRHLIGIRKDQLLRIEQGFEELQKGINYTAESAEAIAKDEEAKFAVLKERVHIMKKIEKMADEAEYDLVLILGKFGILHICRTATITSVNKAAERGVNVRVLTQLDRRTIRFYSELHDSIQVRHSEDLDAQGALEDNKQVIQYLNAEDNPVGRGRNDAALVIESLPFAESQKNLIDTIWEESTDFDTASKRFTEERIADPLKLTIDGGSFLDKIREVLQINEALPEVDTPFNAEAFIASSLEISEARKKLQSGGIASLGAFGINTESLLRQVGNRVGEELAFSLRNIEDHIEFLNEMMDWWEYAGLGQLNYDIDPNFHIKVNLSSFEDSESLPIWSLDDGIIEGALINRYSSDSNVKIEREIVTNKEENFSKYNIMLDSE